MADTERTPGNIESAIAKEVVTSLAIYDGGLDHEEAGDILAAIHQSQEEKVYQPHFNIRQIRVTKGVLTFLQNNRRIPEDEARHALALLDELTPAGPLALSRSNDPIEEVAEQTRREVGGIINYELKNDNKRQQAHLSTLERAIYNMEIINGWVEKGTWLEMYLSRRNKKVTIYDPFPIFSLGAIRGCDSLFFRSVGITASRYPEDLSRLNIQFLEEAWDQNTNNKYLVNKLAGLRRDQFANKVLRSIS